MFNEVLLLVEKNQATCISLPLFPKDAMISLPQMPSGLGLGPQGCVSERGPCDWSDAQLLFPQPFPLASLAGIPEVTVSPRQGLEEKTED